MIRLMSEMRVRKKMFSHECSVVYFFKCISESNKVKRTTATLHSALHLCKLSLSLPHPPGIRGNATEAPVHGAIPDVVRISYGQGCVKNLPGICKRVVLQIVRNDLIGKNGKDGKIGGKFSVVCHEDDLTWIARHLSSGSYSHRLDPFSLSLPV